MLQNTVILGHFEEPISNMHHYIVQFTFVADTDLMVVHMNDPTVAK